LGKVIIIIYTMREKLIVPAIRGIQGDWVYYNASLNSQQISDWVEAAKDIKVAKSLDEYLQRTLKNREKEIAKYILENEQHFFNSILIGVYGGIPEWIEFDFSKKMQELNASSSNDYKDSMGLLVFEGDEQMFAIDGQHRVMGIIEALRNNNANAIGNRVELDDKYPVIFLAHIDDTEGRKRTRRLFSDINQKAKPIPPKDKVIIDEDDIFALVTRKIYAEYHYFQEGELIDIDSNKNSLEQGDTSHFTNITNLYKVIKELKPLFQKAENSKYIDDVNIGSLYNISSVFLDFIFNNINEYKSFFIDKNISLEDLRLENKYLLFRPVGFTLISKIYRHFSQKNKLNILKNNIGSLSFILPNSPFNRILWNNGKMETIGKNQTLAFNLSLYLLGEDVPRKTIENLELDFQNITKNETATLPPRILERN